MMIRTVLGAPRLALWSVLTLLLFFGLWVESWEHMSQPQLVTVLWPVGVLFLPVLFVVDLFLSISFGVWRRAPLPGSLYVLFGYYLALTAVISLGYWAYGIVGVLME